MVSIRDRGARSRVQATGVGAPRLGEHRDDRLADAQRRQVAREVVELGLGVGAHRLRQRLLVIRVKARNACWMRAPTGRAPRWARRWAAGCRRTPRPLGPDQLHGLFHLLQERLGGIGEQQVRLVEEEHQLRLVDVADLRQVGEQVGQHPHQEGGEHHRASRLVTQFQQRDDTAALSVDPQQIRGVDLRLTEERVTALGLEIDQCAQDHPGRLRRHPADRLELLLALIAGEMGDHRPKIPGPAAAALLVGPVEDQAEGGLLGCVEPQNL